MPSLPAGRRSAAVGGPAGPPYSYAEYLAAPRAVPCARQHARGVLRAWGLEALAGTAELLASELVTNAVRASVAAGQPAVRLLLTRHAGGLRISVWDGAPGVPRPRPGPAGDADGGRGRVPQRRLWHVSLRRLRQGRLVRDNRVALLHTDWSPDNMLVSGDRAWLVDWAWPTVGAGWADPAHLDRFAVASVRLWAEIAQASSSLWTTEMAHAARGWAAYRGCAAGPDREGQFHD